MYIKYKDFLNSDVFQVSDKKHLHSSLHSYSHNGHWVLYDAISFSPSIGISWPTKPCIYYRIYNFTSNGVCL